VSVAREEAISGILSPPVQQSTLRGADDYFLFSDQLKTTQAQLKITRSGRQTSNELNPAPIV
jgi:hypothetical protein